MNMSYREDLKIKIREIEKRMAKDESEKLQFEIELNKLRLAEFEEDIRETAERQLLKG
jgi:hypothetical protein